MMLKKFNVLSSHALAMTVTLFVALIGGCDRRDEVYPLEGNAYANDPAYIAQLDAQIKKRDTIQRAFIQPRREWAALIKQANGNFAAVTNTPRGLELYQQVRSFEEQMISNRFETAAIIRDRKSRAMADSERIRRGEAKAIDISKQKEEK